MRPRPGGVAWLLAHEARLGWRQLGVRTFWILGIGGALLWASFHVVAWGAMRALVAGDGVPPAFLVTAGIAYWVIASLMLSQCMAHVVSAVFDRGDLDLLLSSPVAAGRVLAARGLVIATGATLLPAFLLLPFAHMGLAQGRPAFMLTYLVLAGTALGAAGAGLVLTLGLVAVLGARRARVVAQVGAAVAGAFLFLLSQGPTLLSWRQREALAAAFKAATAEGGVLAAGSVLWWPAEGMLGAPGPALAAFALGVFLFAFAVDRTWRRFAAGAMDTIAVPAPRRAAGRPRFQGGLPRLLLVKEWRLILRDPQVISHSLLQLLYLVPLVFLALKSEKTAWLLVPAFVMLCTVLAGNLAWLTLAAEDAPDLLGTAPVRAGWIRMVKGCAAVAPGMLVILPVVAWWSRQDPWGAFVLAFCCLGGMASAALCQIWNPQQGDRRNLRQRHRKGLLNGLLEGIGSFGWAGLAAVMSGYWAWLPLALLVALMGPASAWVLGRRARADGALA